MDLTGEPTHITEDSKETAKIKAKRKCEDNSEGPKKKVIITEAPNAENKTQLEKCAIETISLQDDLDVDNNKNKFVPSTSRNSTETKSPAKKTIKSEVPQSPKKRLEIKAQGGKQINNKQRFIYGNYNQYYGYRNNTTGSNTERGQQFHDIRLDVFEQHKELFREKQVLDIGCNNGFITMEVAKKLEIKSIVGLDIDKQLINQAVKLLIKHKKSLPMENDLKRRQIFPFNVSFVHGNYVVIDNVLLEIERPQFDLIMCLSITKWIQLNFGDDGLKLAFKRMYLQLRPKGVLILEAQPYDNYGRRKKMTDTIFDNYKAIKLFPNDFEAYLLSPEVGFSKSSLMGVPDHCKKGFKRPIQIFYKE